METDRSFRNTTKPAYVYKMKRRRWSRMFEHDTSMLAPRAIELKTLVIYDEHASRTYKPTPWTLRVLLGVTSRVVVSKNLIIVPVPSKTRFHACFFRPRSVHLVFPIKID